MHQAHLYVSALTDVLGAPAPGALAVYTLPQVISKATTWVRGILASVATLFLVLGGLRYVLAGGDPAAIEQAKGSFKAAGIGYALAMMAQPILDVIRGIVGA